MSHHQVYAPSKQAKLIPQIDAILTDEWINLATVCTAIHTWTHDPNVSNALNAMFRTGRIMRKTEAGVRGNQKSYFYRRAA